MTLRERMENPNNPETPTQNSPEIPENPNNQAALPSPETIPNNPEISGLLENLSDQETSTFSASEAEAERIDAIPEGEILQGDNSLAVTGTLSKDEFFQAFCCAFGGIHIGVMVLKKVDCQSIPVDPNDVQARAASDALYDLALDYPQYLGWMLKPGNKTMGQLMVIGTFLGGKFMLVRAELAQHQAPMKDVTPSAADPDDNGMGGYDFAPTDDERKAA